MNTEIKVEISCGELIDKLTILSIKADKIKNLDKLKNVKHEYEVLDKISKKLRDINPEKFNLFYKELKEINSRLWEIEDEIRKCEKEGNFGEEFIKLARSVYITNDKRFQAKNNINAFFSSGVVERKIMKITKILFQSRQLN